MAERGDGPAPSATEARAQIYRRRATELQAMAELLHEPGLRTTLLMTAQDYLRMATALDKSADAARCSKQERDAGDAARPFPG
jgi:hypothetical protein